MGTVSPFRPENPRGLLYTTGLYERSWHPTTKNKMAVHRCLRSNLSSRHRPLTEGGRAPVFFAMNTLWIFICWLSSKRLAWKPPLDFRSNFEATPPPILIDNGVAILENDRIERHIMKNIPGGHNIFVADKEVATKIENVFSKFKLMLLKKDETSKANLLSILRKINDHLEEKQSRFLTGETMCCFDCELMPKLQHIRVAGEFFTDFHIPGDLRALWRYFNEMYQLDAFTQSCPADQDIINHYKLQQGTKMTKREELEPPTFSNTVPTVV